MSRREKKRQVWPGLVKEAFYEAEHNARRSPAIKDENVVEWFSMAFWMFLCGFLTGYFLRDLWWSPSLEPLMQRLR